MNRKERRQLQKAASAHFDGAAVLRQARDLFNRGELRGAQQACRQVLKVQPRNPDALNFCGVINIQQGKVKAGIKFLKQATKANPGHAQAYFNLGTAYAAMADLKRARDCHRRALEIDPGYVDAHYNLANVLRQLDVPEEAEAGYRRALELDSKHPGAATNLASLYLEQGAPADALAACEVALSDSPGDRDALAFKAIACSELGDAAAAHAILNIDEFVRCYDHSCPADFGSIEEFNGALVEHVLKHPTLSRNAENLATRNGWQTENLSLGSKGPIATLEMLIGDALDDYLSAVPPSPSHPYRASMPALTKIDVWGTVLDSQGHQTPHMHRAAWLSGVYYAQLPDVMAESSNGQAGWIEFGRPQDRFPCKIEPEVRMFEPRRGRMFLFPSYLYHRTIPFESTEQRISIAFDLLA